MGPLSPSSSIYEALFHAASVDLVVPEVSALPNEPDTDANGRSWEEWWTSVQSSSKTRTVAFLDERIYHYVGVTIPDNVLVSPGLATPMSDEPPAELTKFIARLQTTVTASFVPPLPDAPVRPEPPPMTGSTLAPPSAHTPRQPQGGYPLSPSGDAFPPITPNPFPAMADSESHYAQVEGVVVWEGAVELQPSTADAGRARLSSPVPRPRVFRGEANWIIVWRGEVPIAYVRTPIANPILALTASVTLRESPQQVKAHRKGAFSTDTASIRSLSTVADHDLDLYDEDADGLAAMEEIDLLGGLGGADGMPATRLAPSLREDLSIPPGPVPSPIPLSAITPATAPPIEMPASAAESANGSRVRGMLPSTLPIAPPTTLRKSYRRILSLSSGLRVRMRTLFLPQLLLPGVSSAGEEAEGEKKIVLCVEIENPVDAATRQEFGFEVSRVNIEIGGKGGKAHAELSSADSIFPLKLDSVEQYNLLYSVSLASPDPTTAMEDLSRQFGKGQETRPVSITVTGQPYIGDMRPTKEFQSRWNCTLDLSQYLASLSAPPSAVQPRFSLPPAKPTLPNAIAGDKRYSLASMLSDRDQQQHRPDQRRLVSNAALRPVLPSQNMGRHASFRPPPPHLVNGGSLGPGAGLLVSAKILPSDHNEVDEGVKALEPFTLEVFVHNRTDEMRRFRLSVPVRAQPASVQAVLSQREKMEGGLGEVDEIALRAALQGHLASSPALLPLENDVRCGPLLPGASLSARMRFLALRAGTHKIDRMRISGVGEDFEYVLSPVLDVIVGSA